MADMVDTVVVTIEIPYCGDRDMADQRDFIERLISPWFPVVMVSVNHEWVDGDD